jgi:hypothetical protein
MFNKNYLMKLIRACFLTLVILLFFSSGLMAQPPVKKVLRIDDFKDWNVLSNGNISYNGEYVSFELGPQKGDGNLIVFNGSRSDTISRGYSATFGSANGHQTSPKKEN